MMEEQHEDGFATMLRLFRTWERLNGTLLALEGVRKALAHTEELAGADLAPELAEADRRLQELVGHLTAASTVLELKIGLAVE